MRLFATKIVVLIFLGLGYHTQLIGVTRSHGLGFRSSFWNVTDQRTQFNIGGMGADTDFTISGAGGGIYFFSRVHSNLFFELAFDAVSAVEGSSRNYVTEQVDVSTIIPLLFGLRYDILSTRFSSAFQPYLSAGGGPYWGLSVSVSEDFQNEEQQITSNSNYGAYLGGGTNVMLASWFGLNFDLKYHFVDLRRDHPYSGFQFGFGFAFMWGKKREIFEIEDIKVIVENIYPTFYQFYNTYPLALVSIKNVAGYPIEINIKCNLEGYSERTKESGFVQIERGKSKDIPVTAIFGPNLTLVNRRAPAVLNLEIEARAGGSHKKEFNTQIMVHHRNAWDGELNKLIYFVTPDEDHILDLSRLVVNSLPENEDDKMTNFQVAKALFHKLNEQGLRYQRDPNIPFYQDDRVQFANETLNIGSGDCDDLVVLYASLLESAGINTAFVEVRDPEKAIAHLYLMFDTGIPPHLGSQLTSNEKRYILRGQAANDQTIWIPVETTLVGSDFDTAWRTGAKEYLEDGILRGGIPEGWMKVINVE